MTWGEKNRNRIKKIGSRKKETLIMELEVELWNSWEIDRQIRLTELKAEQERETGGATGDSGNVNEEPGPW